MQKIRCPLNASSHMSPNEVALLLPDVGVMIYSELEQSVVAAEQLLVDRGIVSGDHVVLLTSAYWRDICILFALWRCGAVVALADGSADDWRDAASAMGARVLVGSVKDKDSFGFKVICIEEVTGFLGRFVQQRTVQYHTDHPCVFVPDETGQIAGFSFLNMHLDSLGMNQVMRVDSRKMLVHDLPLHSRYGLSVLVRAMVVGCSFANVSFSADWMEAFKKEGEGCHLVLTGEQFATWYPHWHGKDGWKSIDCLEVVGETDDSLVRQALGAHLPLIQVSTHPMFLGGLTVSGRLSGGSHECRTIAQKEILHEDGKLLAGGLCRAGWVLDDSGIQPVEPDTWCSVSDTHLVSHPTDHLSPEHWQTSRR
ncbi:MAG: hypothetical protein EOL87_10205 [Spartobacteria bacterium]|nr:hypothetical protein [Spartobacteria bacterium]